MSIDHKHLHMQQALYILLYVCTQSGSLSSKKVMGNLVHI